MMLLQLSDAMFAMGGAALDQMQHMAASGGTLLIGFAVNRVAFVMHDPASAVIGLLGNIFIAWWFATDKPSLMSHRLAAEL